MMGFLQTSTRTRIGIGLCVFGWIFNVIGFSTPGWLMTTPTNGSTAYILGLFHACQYRSLVLISHCGALPDKKPSWWATTKQLHIVGMLLGVACVAVLFGYALVKNDKKWLTKVGLVLALASATFIAAGATVFGVSSNEITDDYFEEIERTQFTISWSYTTLLIGVIQMLMGVLMA
ncbi:uncharacterized protein [Haliotis cracherodii]|uniref:uncharacterized protein n=1 Tax=Haliotis cracherodii TaxID=6455 RepID=UPI0039E7D71B